MRGFKEPVRVCDTCFRALRTGTAAQGRPTPTATVAGAGTGANRTGRNPPNAQLNGGVAVDGSAARPGGAEATSAFADGAVDDASATPTGESRGKAVTPTPAANGERSEEEQKAHAAAPPDDAWDDVYGNPAGNADAAAAANVVPEESAELAERERLLQRWAAVRQDAIFVDILVQRAERVEQDSVVEYSRETESITLQPEVPANVLATTLLPLPAPADNSARYLVEPVRPLISAASLSGPVLTSVLGVAEATGKRVSLAGGRAEKVRRREAVQFEAY